MSKAMKLSWALVISLVIVGPLLVAGPAVAGAQISGSEESQGFLPR